MSHLEIQRRARRDNQLLSALVELTYRCNLNCFFCYNDTQLSGVPLSTEQYIRFFEELRDLGTLNLAFSGGEPLARADFFTLGRQAREWGFVVRVKSNGHALNSRLARRLKDEVDPFSIEISLHGACAETHDRQTRIPGSFGKLIANLGEMRALGLRINLNVPLTAWNEAEIESMFALADDWGLPIHFDSQIKPRDNGDGVPLQIAASLKGVARLVAIQRQRTDQQATKTQQAAEVQTPATKQCGAGSTTITVDPFGNVYPCVQWRRRVGNLHHHSIKAIWERSQELAEVRRMASEVKRTLGRHIPPGMGFCPGLAEQATGSPAVVYPAFQRLLELRRQPIG